MQIKIKVITNAKKERIIKDGEIFPRAKRETAPLFEKKSHSGEGIYKVYVSVPPIEGRANQRIIELLADFFKVKKSQITIISGLKFKEKIIRIDY
ncbi:MAG: DUF167 domain-containing protein [Patescibacteria group bacterium]